MNKMILDALLIAGGFLMGLLIGVVLGAGHNRKHDYAPVPMGYDENNPINAKGRQTVNVCGRDWYLMK